MIIRKLFKYEMSHRVYDAYTKRCSENVHGHSYKLELKFVGNEPDNAQMLMDFGLVKKYFHPFVDSFDHSHMVWSDLKLKKEIDYFSFANERAIFAPFSSTAEMQAKMFVTFGEIALDELHRMNLINDNLLMYSAIVHETDTGYAEYFWYDRQSCKFPKVQLKDIHFSEGIKKEWPVDFKAFYTKILET